MQRLSSEKWVGGHKKQRLEKEYLNLWPTPCVSPLIEGKNITGEERYDRKKNDSITQLQVEFCFAPEMTDMKLNASSVLLPVSVWLSTF